MTTPSSPSEKSTVNTGDTPPSPLHSSPKKSVRSPSSWTPTTPSFQSPRRQTPRRTIPSIPQSPWMSPNKKRVTPPIPPSPRLGIHPVDSFDETTSTLFDVLCDIFAKNRVHMGGTAMGQGLAPTARFYLEQRKKDKVQSTRKDPFAIVDVGMVLYQYWLWKRHFFPRVKVVLPVGACLYDPVLVASLIVAGCQISCTTLSEIQWVREQIAKANAAIPNNHSEADSLLLEPDIFLAHPRFPPWHIQEAVSLGVKLMAVDSQEQIRHCADASRSIKLLLRIATPCVDSRVSSQNKFGAVRSQWKDLLSCAKELALDVEGVSFDIEQRNLDVYTKTLRDAKDAADLAQSMGFDKCKLIDIGRGFPGKAHEIWNLKLRDDESSTPSLDKNPHFFFLNDLSDHLGPLLDKIFPPESGFKLVGQPGRYLVASCTTKFISVYAVRSNTTDMGTRTHRKPFADLDVSTALAALDSNKRHKLIQQICKRLVGLQNETSGEKISKNEGDAELNTGSGESKVESIGQVDSASFPSANVSSRVNHLSERIVSDVLIRHDFDAVIDRINMTDVVNAPIEKGSFNYEEIFSYHKNSLLEFNQRGTVEGMPTAVVQEISTDDNEQQGMGGEGRIPKSADVENADFLPGGVMGLVAPAEDRYSYYLTEGVLGAFGGSVYNVTSIRPRSLRSANCLMTMEVSVIDNGLHCLEAIISEGVDAKESPVDDTRFSALYLDRSTFERSRLTILNTPPPLYQDSCDVVARSILLPKLEVGDWLYFSDTGSSSTIAEADGRFLPREIFYVCSIDPEKLEMLLSSSSEEDRLNAADVILFVDIKCGSLFAVNRMDVIERKVLTPKDGNKLDFVESGNRDDATHDRMVECMMRSPNLGFSPHMVISKEDIEEYEMAEAEKVKNMWGVNLKKRERNKKGEEFLFFDLKTGASGELSRKKYIDMNFITPVTDKGNGTETLEEQEKDSVLYDRYIAELRRMFGVTLE